MKLKNKNIWSVLLIIFIVAFDQITKYFAKSALYPNGAKSFIPDFLEFRYAENTGIAFSLFSGGRWLFSALTVVVTVAMLVYMFKKCQKSLWLYWTLALLAAGAIGNLIDRVLLGYVVDFINPVFVNFAIFNIADCAVTLGAVSLVANLICDLFKKEEKNEQAN